MTRRGLLVLAAAGLVTLIWAALPPATRHLDRLSDPRIAVGAIHVHTRRSDGAGTIDDVARAAAAAGLRFVVLSDHGDATRPVEPPAWRHGVLVVDAVEISTTGGHYLALDLPQAPYRLAGEPRDVIEDVHRLGGFGFAAHPSSARPELRWRDWDDALDGLEWLNADSEWRDEAPVDLGRALVAYWLRGPETIAMLFDRPSSNLRQWDALTRERQVVGIAAHDAHASLGAGRWESSDHGWWLRAPSYVVAFRAFAVRVLLPEPFLPDDAAVSARMLMAGLKAGHTYTVVDALAGPAQLAFTASSTGVGPAEQGDRLDADTAVTLHAVVRPQVDDARLLLLRNGEAWQEVSGTELRATHPAGGRGTYRVEVHLPAAPGVPPIPWIVSNPIYIGLPEAEPPTATAGAERDFIQRAVIPAEATTGWQLERHPASTAVVEPEVGEAGQTWWRFEWRLGAGSRAGQYAALVAPVPAGALDGIDRLRFRARASRPMRISVQVRVPEGSGLRWHRSVYLDQATREVIVPLGEMTPIESPPATPVPSAGVDSLLFVIDTVNTVPGRSGEVWLSEVRWEGSAADQVRTVNSR